MTKRLIKATLLCTLVSASAWSQVNVGDQKSEDPPFDVTAVTTLELPWRLAFLPDGRMLVTEKVGPVMPAARSISELEISFVNEPCRRQGSPTAMGGEPPVSNGAQVLVGKADDFVDGFLSHVVIRRDSPLAG